jgi:uncharacterized protein (UPF0333 family)
MAKKGRRAQGSFEYMLLLAGMVLIVMIVVLIVLGSTSDSGNIIHGQVNQYTHYVWGSFTATPTP